jgi:putative hydrolase of the HAD superfamily
MIITTLIFDLDDTLMEQRPANRAAYQAVAEYARRDYGVNAEALSAAVNTRGEELYRSGPLYEYCQSVGIGRTECLWGEITDTIPQIQQLAAWVPRFRHETWRAALADVGIDNEMLAEELVARFIDERTKRQIVFPDVEPVLSELQNHYTLALLTNGCPSLQRYKINASCLADYFTARLISGNLGVGKPDPRIFRRIVQDLEVEPGAAIMIGDSISRDILGAQHAGLRAIWLNRFGDPLPDGPAPDSVIETLTQLPLVLEDL